MIKVNQFYLGLNKLADLSLDEFHQTYTGGKSYNSGVPIVGSQFDCPEQFDDTTTEIPSNFDWRFSNTNNLGLVAVTAVKDQGSCGSCWTFGAASAMEGSLCMQGFYDCSNWPGGLSEQNILDCASNNATFLGVYNNHGCGGGEQSNAMRWAYLSGGMSQDTTYSPYIAQKQDCTQPGIDATVTDQICGTTSYNGADAPLMARAIMAKGPTTIGIDAGGVSFQLYSGGIYESTTCSGNKINHAVTAVGFGTENDEEYWVIKNSWGSSWGLDGYILVKRGVDMCGVERDTQYALMSMP